MAYSRNYHDVATGLPEDVKLNKVFADDAGDNHPYGVELLIGCDDNDETVGYSEMAWFATQEEQLAYFHEEQARLKAEFAQ